MEKRRYTRVQEHKEKIYELKREGKTNQEIANILGFANKQVIKDFMKRENGKKNAEKVIPRKKGRLRKNAIMTTKELIKENERLKMENELLRDFLSEIERG